MTPMHRRCVIADEPRNKGKKPNQCPPHHRQHLDPELPKHQRPKPKQGQSRDPASHPCMTHRHHRPRQKKVRPGHQASGHQLRTPMPRCSSSYCIFCAKGRSKATTNTNQRPPDHRRHLHPGLPKHQRPKPKQGQ